MACELTAGHSIDCRDYVGGIKAVYLSNFDNITSYAETAGTMTAITQVALSNFFLYNLEKENGSFLEKQEGNLETGSNMYSGELSFTVKKLSAALVQELKLVALSRLWIIIKDNNDNYFSFGAEFGADMLSSEAGTGKAFGDLNGFTLNFTSKEKNPMVLIPQAVIDTLTVT